MAASESNKEAGVPGGEGQAERGRPRAQTVTTMECALRDMVDVCMRSQDKLWSREHENFDSRGLRIHPSGEMFRARWAALAFTRR